MTDPKAERLAVFDASYEIDSKSGCWLWRGRMTPNGYGKFYANGRNQVAHRYSWQRQHGPIPDGVQMDHVCRVRNCVNPSHLRMTDVRGNLFAPGTEAPAAINAAKTHCLRGHAFTPENTLVQKGKRQCRSCRFIRGRSKRSREADQFKRLPLFAWKTVDCPTCDSRAGESCGGPTLGAPAIWQRSAPHVARKRVALVGIDALLPEEKP